MKKVVIYILLLGLFQACVIIHTPGFNSGYNRLSDEEQEQICYINSVNEIPCQNDGRIIAITADQLSFLLKKKENVLLYVWSPHCSSSVCVSLKTIQDYCDSVNICLYVLTEYYTDAWVQNKYLSNPMLSINHFYYGTNYCNLYLRRFFAEIIPKDSAQDILFNRFIWFSKGDFVQSYEKVEDIDVM